MLFLSLCGYLLLGLLKEDYFLAFLGGCFSPRVGVFHLLSFVELDLQKRYCVNLFLSWDILVSPSMLIERFFG